MNKQTQRIKDDINNAVFWHREQALHPGCNTFIDRRENKFPNPLALHHPKLK
jgi:hypothetical protein